METEHQREDVQAVKAIIARQFASLSWTRETPAGWDAFAAISFTARRFIRPVALRRVSPFRHSSTG